MTPLLGLVTALLLGGSATLWTGDTRLPVLAASALLGPGLLVVSARFAWTGHGRTAMLLAGGGVLLSGVAHARVADLRAWYPPRVDVGWLEQQAAADAVMWIEGRLRHDAAPSPAGAVLDLRIDTVDVDNRRIATDLGARVTVGGALAANALPAWTRGRRIRAPVSSLRRPLPYRNIDVPDAERELARRRLRMFGSIKSAALVTCTPGPWWEEAAAGVRARVRSAVRRAIPDAQAAAVVIAILIGDRTGLTPEDERRLQQAGTYHVIAISGGNVALWLGALAWLPRWRRAGVRTATIVLATGLLAFAWCVDGGASVARASCVAALWLVARWWDLRTSGLQVIAGAALCVVAIDPLTLHDPGFLLSFGATLALVLLGLLTTHVPTSQVSPQTTSTGGAIARSRRLHAIARTLILVVAATASVELLLLPIGARWFSLVTGVGLIANLAALPAMALVQAAGIITVVLDLIGMDGTATLAGRLTIGGERVLVGSGELVHLLPWLVRYVPPPPLAVVCGYYATLAMAAWLLWPGAASARASRCVGLVCACVATTLLVAMVAAYPFSRPSPPWEWADVAAHVQTGTWPRDRWLTVTILDVGQGDATAIQLPSGKAWLVDAGGAPVGSTFDVGARVTVPALWALGVTRLDRLVITHGDADHAGGVPGVLARVPTRELVVGVPVPEDPIDAAALATAEAHHTRVRVVRTGHGFVDEDVHMRVLHPPAPDWIRVKVRNDDSVALWIRYGDVGILLPGDAAASVEDAWRAQLTPTPITVVRAGHHGSRSSTGHRLLHHLQPALVVVSSGRGNRFGHPHPDVLARTARAGAQVLRTDTVGAIQLATNGHVLVVRTADGQTEVRTRGQEDQRNRGGRGRVR